MRKLLPISAALTLILCLIHGCGKDKENSENSPQPSHIITNSIGMKFAYIRPGTFQMGSPPAEKYHQGDEFQHTVRITRPFYMAVTEVTQQQFETVMGFNPSNFDGNDLPIEKVSWNWARDFCQKLSEKEGCAYRLPTEAQWEYACRAGSNSAAPTQAELNQIAWYQDNSGGTTHPVASKKPNKWGLYDMLGNVSEWCRGYYHTDYPEKTAEDPNGPLHGAYKVIRGGSWGFFAPSLRPAARASEPPSYQLKQTGFRIIMQITQSDSQ